MAKDTPSMAKNKIKRSLGAICDPHPSKKEEDALWMYFNFQCAYCGILIERASRTGHLDHLIPASEGGTNSIYNHALSCAKCNGDEKREGEWDSFLKVKALSNEIYEIRKNKIEAWLKKSPKVLNDPDFIAMRDRIINKAIADFDVAVSKMRELRNKCT
ncbi:HNH endonuclease [Simiduia agarivorans]|uniref:HNH endonuclease n=1 Tax=Simiduia agarivorans (strain DSM 21679 / JCM 13881 / BCRC 17597 / SA1) TaxID=1117647 RepID=R9S663_SIMAS|nr:HNH endonuclease signature motif containing protein [Simiduia agarivorans]AGN11343.1 HNH endonuclease [Simiduia agarivorans SA1 = DSM 21679]